MDKFVTFKEKVWIKLPTKQVFFALVILEMEQNQAMIDTLTVSVAKTNPATLLHWLWNASMAEQFFGANYVHSSLWSFYRM